MESKEISLNAILKEFTFKTFFSNNNPLSEQRNNMFSVKVNDISSRNKTTF